MGEASLAAVPAEEQRFYGGRWRVGEFALLFRENSLSEITSVCLSDSRDSRVVSD